MANRPISELPAAEQITNTDLFVLEQNNAAKSLTGAILLRDLALQLDAHGGISNISYTAPVAPSLDGTLTITLSDNTSYTVTVTNGNGVASIVQYWAVSSSNSTAPSTWYTTLQTMTVSNRYLWSYTRINYDDGTHLDTTKQVIGVYGDTGQNWYVHIKYASQEPDDNRYMGDTPDKWIGLYSGTSAVAPSSYTAYTWYEWKGLKGDTGNGIASIIKTSTSGAFDTYTIYLDNGNTGSFTVTNGSNIDNIAKTGTSGLRDTYTVTLTDNSTTTFEVVNGISITSITWTNSDKGNVPKISGATDTYLITYNNGDTGTFQVYNGLDGTGANISVDDIPSSNGNVDLLTIGNGAPTAYTAGSVKSRYFDATDSILYICVGYNDQTQAYDWRGAGVTVDSAMSTSSTNPVQNAVISTKVGTSSLNTTATDLSSAINEHESDITGINNKIGSTVLPTTAQTLTGAIAEHETDIAGVAAYEALHLTVASFSSLPTTISNANITASQRVISCVFGTPSSIKSDISWTTAAGSLTLSGTISGSTTAEITLIKTN